MFSYSLIHNGGLAPLTENWFVGPTQLTLIQLGAKYKPCMKNDPSIIGNPAVLCHSNIPINYKLDNGSCLYYDNLRYICGMGGFANPSKPVVLICGIYISKT